MRTVILLLAALVLSACAPSPGQEPGGRLTEARVVRTVDGDTIEVQAVRGPRLPSPTVRLIGVDTPEISGRTEPYGPEAARFTRERLLGRTVWLERDVSDTDRYGRALRYVWLAPPPPQPDEEDVRRHMFNAHLLLEGYAQVYTAPPDVKYAELFVKFQREARTARRGLWSLSAPGPAPAPAVPHAPGAPASPAPGPRRCDPAYPDVCIPPPPPDLDCGDIPYRRFRVLPPDPHGFDRDRDGIGCEAGAAGGAPG